MQGSLLTALATQEKQCKEPKPIIKQNTWYIYLNSFTKNPYNKLEAY